MGEFKVGDRVRVTPPEGYGAAYEGRVRGLTDSPSTVWVVTDNAADWPRYVQAAWLTPLPDRGRGHVWEQSARYDGVRCSRCGYYGVWDESNRPESVILCQPEVCPGYAPAPEPDACAHRWRAVERRGDMIPYECVLCGKDMECRPFGPQPHAENVR